MIKTSKHDLAMEVLAGRWNCDDLRDENAALLARVEELEAVLGHALDFIVAGIIAAQTGATVMPAPYVLESEIRAALSGTPLAEGMTGTPVAEGISAKR